ncbi:MAG: class I SAM-dependent methyltransferase family protein [Desulfurococcales archaeon]|nr:class I SAM-dependent methyltransferase family protein [Desulfurococcales archaeon]
MARLLRKIAEEVLGPGKAGKVWSRIDIVGDIAVIKKPFTPDVTLEDLRRLGEELVKRLPYIRSVWLAAGPVEGAYKTREYIHLAGEERSDTIYVEHGCKFHVDIRKVFITPRLNYEHLRVARLVGRGETVTNMFAGAGLFSIIIACKSSPRKVYSIDVNPHAYEFMVENARLNRVENVVEPILGDARDVIGSRLSGTSDRVLMPLPELAIEYLPYALEALRGGKGVVHVYLHVHYAKGEDPLEKSARLVARRLEELGVSDYRISLVRRVRPVGPRTLQTVVDVVIV